MPRFGAYRFVDSHDWAMGAEYRFALPALGEALVGWAAIRSGGLAPPIGLHRGGSWVQAQGAVFQPTGHAAAVPVAGFWRISVTAAGVHALTAPDLSAQLP